MQFPDRRFSTTDRVAVIGLGRFGSSLARALHSIGYDVTAIDMDERVIQEAADYVTLAAQGDGTDQELLLQLQINKSDVVVVAQAEHLEASLLTTMLLKKLNVPWVVAKAKTALHGELLQKVGADRVVFPEFDAGVRLAHGLGVRHIRDYITLSPNAGIAKLQAPTNLIGRTVGSCVGSQSKLNVLLIRRGNDLITVPHFQEVIQEHDELVIVGNDAEIERFAESKPQPDRG